MRLFVRKFTLAAKVGSNTHTRTYLCSVKLIEAKTYEYIHKGNLTLPPAPLRWVNCLRSVQVNTQFHPNQRAVPCDHLRAAAISASRRRCSWTRAAGWGPGSRARRSPAYDWRRPPSPAASRWASSPCPESSGERRRHRVRRTAVWASSGPLGTWK